MFFYGPARQTDQFRFFTGERAEESNLHLLCFTGTAASAIHLEQMTKTESFHIRGRMTSGRGEKGSLIKLAYTLSL